MSSDNSTWSNSTQVLVYDPQYVTCIDDGNQTSCLPAQVDQPCSSALDVYAPILSVLLLFCFFCFMFFSHKMNNKYAFHFHFLFQPI